LNLGIIPHENRSFFLAFLVALLAIRAGAASAAAPKPPNNRFHLFRTITLSKPSALLAKRGTCSTLRNIDRIAREGMRFDRCLVTNSSADPAARRC